MLRQDLQCSNANYQGHYAWHLVQKMLNFNQNLSQVAAVRTVMCMMASVIMYSTMMGETTP